MRRTVVPPARNRTPRVVAVWLVATLFATAFAVTADLGILNPPRAVASQATTTVPTQVIYEDQPYQVRGFGTPLSVNDPLVYEIQGVGLVAVAAGSNELAVVGLQPTGGATWTVPSPVGTTVEVDFTTAQDAIRFQASLQGGQVVPSVTIDPPTTSGSSAPAGPTGSQT